MKEEVEVDRVHSDEEKIHDACAVMKDFPDMVFDGIKDGRVL